MTAPNTVILSAPAAWQAREGMEALLERFGCDQVIDEWNPRAVHVPGALHLTTMRPEALLKQLQFNKPWLVRHMKHFGWDEQRQRIADHRQQVTRTLVQGLATLAFFIAALGIVGPAIDQPADHDAKAAAPASRSVHRDTVTWADRQGHQQHRNVITVLHRREQ